MIYALILAALTLFILRRPTPPKSAVPQIGGIQHPSECVSIGKPSGTFVVVCEASQREVESDAVAVGGYSNTPHHGQGKNRTYAE